LKEAILLKQKSAGQTAPAATPDVATDPQQESDYQAYFNAGYSYDDAVALGKIWNETDTDQVKAQAGQKLIDGDTLPVKPSGTPAPPEDRAAAAFFNAGYDYNDAVKLGHLWNESPSQAKIDGGQKLENGQPLPIQPGG
jgi:hypothetical protein